MTVLFVSILSALCLWSTGSAQYAYFTHVIFADWPIEHRDQTLAYSAPRNAIRVMTEEEYKHDRFTFKGHDYSLNCFPIFKEFREKVPAFEDCTHYYEFVAVFNNIRYVQFSKCEDGKMFDPETKVCIPGMVEDCIKILDNCQHTASLHYIGIIPPRNWLLGNGQTFHKKHLNDKSFYIGHDHYFNNCFPIFLEKDIGKNIPDPVFCNRFYTLEEARPGSNVSIIALRSCVGKSVYSRYDGVCIFVDEMPDDCKKNIPGCEDPIETGLIVGGKRTNIIKYSVPNDVIEYPGGSFIFERNLYNDDCWPLTFNEIDETLTAPDPSNCHRYYEGYFDDRPVTMKTCKNASLFFNHQKGICEEDVFPKDCHKHGGCQKGAFMERLDLSVK